MTAHVAFASPQAAVMVAVPAFTAVTVPSLTVAIVLSEEVQTMVLSVVSSGFTMAVSLAVSPSYRFSAVLSSVTPVARMGARTVTTHSAFALPQAAVMVALPSFTAVTTPFFTVATASLEDVHTSVSVVFSGATVAVRVAFSVGRRLSAVSFSVTPVAGTASRVSSIYSS